MTLFLHGIVRTEQELQEGTISEATLRLIDILDENGHTFDMLDEADWDALKLPQ